MRIKVLKLYSVYYLIKNVMRKIRIKMLLLLLAVLSGAMHTFAASVNGDKDSDIEMLRTFYTKYITNMLENKDRENQALKKEYIVPGMLEKIPEMIENSGSDPILRAQDVNQKMLNTLKIKSLDKPGWYMVSYSWDGSDETCIPVKSINSGNKIMIKYIVPVKQGLKYGDELIY